MSCLFCGDRDAQLLEQSKVLSCHRCAPKANALDSDAIKALQELDEIPPAFSLWSRGRREDSGEDAQKCANVPAQPAEIVPSCVPGLFVGDLDDVKNVSRLRELGIGFVLNLCPDRLKGDYADVPSRLAKAGIKQLTWPAEDAWDFDIVSHVAKQGACDFIEMGLRSAGVLVNCWGGVNRSASVAVAFIVMKKKTISLIDAVKSAMSKRGTVLTNRSFRFQLVQLALETGCPLRGAEVGNLSVPCGTDVLNPLTPKTPDAFEAATSEYLTGSALNCDWACTDPQNRHRRRAPHHTTKYGYLFASGSACIKCVKHYVECEKVDPLSKSDTQGYSAIAFAEWELQRAKSEEDVAKYKVVLSYLRACSG